MKSYIDNIGNHKKISGDDQCDFAEKRGYTNEIRVFSSLLGRKHCANGLTGDSTRSDSIRAFVGIFLRFLADSTCRLIPGFDAYSWNPPTREKPLAIKRLGLTRA